MKKRIPDGAEISQLRSNFVPPPFTEEEVATIALKISEPFVLSIPQMEL